MFPLCSASVFCDLVQRDVDIVNLLARPLAKSFYVFSDSKIFLSVTRTVLV